jgi:hypothetical protein
MRGPCQTLGIGLHYCGADLGEHVRCLGSKQFLQALAAAVTPV